MLPGESEMYIRQTAYNGTFYPSDKAKLAAEIDDYLENASSVIKHPTAKGIIVPHAGYVYSGQIAAYSYMSSSDCKPSKIIVLAPSHRYSFEKGSVIPDGLYRTPLGDVKIDVSAADLSQKSSMTFLKAAHDSEHSIEVQVPFLQTVFPNADLIPVLIGSQDPSICTSIASDIASMYEDEKQKPLVVISTDLSHFHRYDEAVQIDNTTMEIITEFNEDTLYHSVQNGSEACGFAAIYTGFKLLKKFGAKTCEKLMYKNSGDASGEKNRVVGYMAAVIY